MPALRLRQLRDALAGPGFYLRHFSDAGTRASWKKCLSLMNCFGAAARDSGGCPSRRP